MPFYEYTSTDESDCPQCAGTFTILQHISDSALSTCPCCGQPVRRVISAPNLVGHPGDDLKPSKIEEAGFTQYRKIGKGVYEKSAGKGPGIISAD
ncbi:zinc ribbon domain-containing protein [Wenzhouxiangella sp. AB-CW3]|uniref:FmdB family zinc ribbon protein n=1 Tax=Wenzhouxiangella sp. AB-CW3 TaxID=2771012 RepID=UPI00168B2B50|nr:zinc ribbon domain-containing protein [Wenzhouxiangella sp. AB-CW3]QOC21125.1 zinc ribbon domain-containing protein [Wenzhouxiangella sp. AB-CW3]